MIQKIPTYKYLLAFFDYVLFLVSFLFAVKMRFSDSSLAEIFTEHGTLMQLGLVAGYGVVWLLIFQHYHLYKINIFLMIVDQIIPVLKAIGYGVIGLMIFSFLLKDMSLVESRLIVGYFALTSLSLTMFFRIGVFRKLFMFLSENRLLQRKVLIIDAGKSGQIMAANLIFDNSHGFNVVGFLDDNLPKGERVFENAYVLGTLSDIKQTVRQRDVEEILVVMDNVGYEQLIEILDTARQTKAMVKVSSKLYDIVPNKVVIEKYLGVPVISMSQNNDQTLLVIYKRIFDVATALLGLVILALPFLIISLIIKLTSKGPIFYKQTRIGKEGKPFDFYKFRSMYANNDDKIHREFAKNFINESKSGSMTQPTDDNGSVKKIVNDPRVTPIGRFLRKTSLDELPQLINVLKGEMSLVGPRPCMPYEWDEYDAWHQRRLSVTPGCTGLWQVSGRSLVGFNDMVILDLYYIDNMSPMLDLKLILKTIPVMFFAKGGY
ncbi:MAG: sugar transferase [Chlorobiales bacterium]|nr:sugar transferase [Chlorobiales bacterium]